MTVKIISPTDVFQLQQESGALTIIDVREREEFGEIRSQLAINMPLSEFDPAKVELGSKKNSSIFVLCRSGLRSLRVAEMLVSA